jgi:hypothetical protein
VSNPFLKLPTNRAANPCVHSTGYVPYLTDDFKVHDYRGQVVGPLYRHSKHAIGLEHMRYHRGLWGH